jgi:hypothetical protein
MAYLDGPLLSDLASLNEQRSALPLRQLDAG